MEYARAGEAQGKGTNSSPSEEIPAFFVTLTLFLFVACGSLCDKANVACIKASGGQDLGLLILLCAVILAAGNRKTRPKNSRKRLRY